MSTLEARITRTDEASVPATSQLIDAPVPPKRVSAAAREHETKFVFDAAIAPHFVNWLRCRCRPDPRFPAGTISSIYYDTPDWQFLREKINSDFLKTKVRLRWYADIDGESPSDHSFLEAKFRTGSQRSKIRLRTDHSGRWLDRVSLGDPRLLGIPRMLGSKDVVFARPLVPTFLIRYKRCRFIEPSTGARLSIDYDIQVPAVNWRMIPRAFPISLRQAVFELKGKAVDLPDILHPLTAMGCRKESFSKYSRCYENIMGVCF